MAGSAQTRMRRKPSLAESTDQGVMIVPFGYKVNGTSDPDGLIGDSVVSVARSEAGEFLLTMRDKGAVIFYGDAQCSNVPDDVDMDTKVDWSSYKSAGTIVVRTMTGAVQTDPADNTLIGGFLLVKKTTRRARGIARP
jgi:hypothetical protein